MARTGGRRAAVDHRLIGQHFVLMVGRRGAAWCAAARAVAAAPRVPIVAHTIGGETIDDRDGAWAATYGVDDAGAVLVRPDGHVAWRRPAAGPAHALADG